MVSETHHLNPVGSLDWFLNDFELIERDEFGLLKHAKKDNVSNFEAIQTVMISITKQDWRLFDSQHFEINEIENLVNVFVKNHSSIPYVGGVPLRTQEPMGCIEGDVKDTVTENKVQCKLAYWGNGVVYYIAEENTDKHLYLLAVDKTTAELYNYPESKKDQSE